MPSKLLAIDSSGSTLRVGLSCKPDDYSELISTDRFRHAEFIFILIEKLLKDNGISRNNLDGIIVSTGPGSFTGLRVGLSTGKGLARALQIPLAGISVFAAISKGIFKQFGETAILIPSRREEYYLYVADGSEFSENGISVSKTSDLHAIIINKPVYITDDAITDPGLKDLNLINHTEYSYSINCFIKAGEKKIENGGDNISELVPMYIQSFQAKKKK